MPLVHTNVEVITGLYDFDTNGGAMGTFNFGITVPRFTFYGFFVNLQVIRTFTGAGNVSFGITYPDGSSPDDLTQIFAPFAVAGLTAGGIFPATPFVFKTSAAVQFVMDLTLNPITSGKLLLQLLYIKQPM